MQKLENWVHEGLQRPQVFWWLTLVTALENTFIPLTLEPIVVPIMAIERDRAWRLALALWIGSVLGGLIMYAIGAGVMDAIAGLAHADVGNFEGFEDYLRTWGFWAIFVFAISPLPYQAATLGAGAADYPFAWFLLAIVFGRGLLYLGFAAGAVLIGRSFAAFVEQHKREIMLGGLGLGLAALIVPLLLAGH